MNRYTALTVAMLALSLSACNSSNDSNSTSSSTVSGKAADGYLVNAKVCLDANQNFKCDTGEVSAMTTANGSYELSASVDALNRYPLLLEATAGQTRDLDLVSATNPNGLVTNDFILYAPPRSSFISPFTSLQYELMQQNPQLSAQAAAEYVQAQFDLSLAVGQDYIAAQNSDAHEKAKAIVKRLTQLSSDTNPNLSQLIGDKVALQRVLFTEFYDNPDQINLNADNILGQIGNQIELTNSQLKQFKTAQQFKGLSSKVVDPDQIFANGIVEPIWAVENNLILNNDSSIGDSADLNVLSNVSGAYLLGLAEYRFRLLNQSLQTDFKSLYSGISSKSSFKTEEWDGRNWLSVDPSTPFSFKIPTRNSCQNLGCLLSMTAIDLSNQSLMSFISASTSSQDQQIDPDIFAQQYQLSSLTFPKGSEAYRVLTKPNPDVVGVYCQSAANTQDQQNCENVFRFGLDQTINTLDDVISSEIQYPLFEPVGIKFSTSDQPNQGTVTYFERRTVETDSSACLRLACPITSFDIPLAQGKWKRISYQGLDLIEISTNLGPEKDILVMYKGQLVWGYRLKWSSQTNKAIYLNDTAMNYLKDVFADQLDFDLIFDTSNP